MTQTLGTVQVSGHTHGKYTDESSVTEVNVGPAYHHRKLAELVVLEPEGAQVTELLDLVWNVSDIVTVARQEGGKNALICSESLKDCNFLMCGTVQWADFVQHLLHLVVNETRHLSPTCVHISQVCSC